LSPDAGTATRVALFRMTGRSTRAHAAPVVTHLRERGITSIECGDRPDLPLGIGLGDLSGDYHAVLQLGDGAGAALVPSTSRTCTRSSSRPTMLPHGCRKRSPSGADVLAAGFDLLPTIAAPHYTVLLPSYDEGSAQRLLDVLGDMKPNPFHTGSRP
jgi:hypothetical protein